MLALLDLVGLILVGHLLFVVVALPSQSVHLRTRVLLGLYHIAISYYLVSTGVKGWNNPQQLSYLPYLFGFFTSHYGLIAYYLAKQLFSFESRSWDRTLSVVAIITIGINVFVTVDILAGRLIALTKTLYLTQILTVQLPCIGLATFRMLRERREDLDSERRQWRLIFAASIMLVGLIIIGSYITIATIPLERLEQMLGLSRTDARAPFMRLGWLISFAYALAIPPLLIGRRGASILSQTNPAAVLRDTVQALTISSADRAELARLNRLMDEEKLYRRAGLSIGALADAMAMPERDLRALINQNLGHRNFNQFLNSYRLADAQALLADPAMERLPILTIALDLGFGSAPSFNRVFKAEIGVTPSEYREAALGSASTNLLVTS